MPTRTVPMPTAVAPFEVEREESAFDPASSTLNSIAALHLRTERSVEPSQRLIENWIEFVGRPRFLLVALGFVGLWIAVNTLGSYIGLRRLDKPPYGYLETILTICALLLTIMILIAENRQAIISERRSQLDLQMSLLSDQRSAKIIELLEELRRDMPQVRDRRDPVAEAMQSAADPEAMVVALDYMLSESTGEDTRAAGGDRA